MGIIFHFSSSLSDSVILILEFYVKTLHRLGIVLPHGFCNWYSLYVTTCASQVEEKRTVKVNENGESNWCYFQIHEFLSSQFS